MRRAIYIAYHHVGALWQVQFIGADFHAAVNIIGQPIARVAASTEVDGSRALRDPSFVGLAASAFGGGDSSLAGLAAAASERLAGGRTAATAAAAAAASSRAAEQRGRR